MASPSLWLKNSPMQLDQPAQDKSQERGGCVATNCSYNENMAKFDPLVRLLEQFSRDRELKEQLSLLEEEAKEWRQDES